MVSKSRPRATKKDHLQDKRIAKLERQFPTVKEVINNTGSQTFTTSGGTPVTSHVYDLLPSALNDEKIEFLGYRFRGNVKYASATSGGTPPGDAICRYIMLMYKCTVDYSGASPSVTSPTLLDILNDNSDVTQANYNPDNRNRMRIIFDKRVVTNQIQENYILAQSRNYKKSVSLMPTIDKAFVLRPFLLVMTNNVSGTNLQQVSQDIDLFTRQNPK